MAEYTPGPWERQTMGSGLIGSDRSMIAIIDFYQPNVDANARLIVAAPDTFDALNMALPYLCNCYSSDCPAYAVRVQALAAIAKATGGI